MGSNPIGGTDAELLGRYVMSTQKMSKEEAAALWDKWAETLSPEDYMKAQQSGWRPKITSADPDFEEFDYEAEMAAEEASLRAFLFGGGKIK